MERLSREQLYIESVNLLARRSTCSRAQVASIIVLENRIISQGYAGSPSGSPHCLDVGCLILEGATGCQRTIHAEANAIAFAAKHGLRIEGGHLYCTFTPCLNCAKLVINSGISHFYYLKEYRDNAGALLLQSSGIPVLPALGKRQDENN